MGQKTNPVGLRLGIIKSWESKWYSEKDYSKLLQEDINLDEFCQTINVVRLHSTLASAARMVVVAYFCIFDGLNRPPFMPVDHNAPTAMQEPYSFTNTVLVLPLAIRRFAQDEAND